MRTTVIACAAATGAVATAALSTLVSLSSGGASAAATESRPSLAANSTALDLGPRPVATSGTGFLSPVDWTGDDGSGSGTGNGGAAGADPQLAMLGKAVDLADQLARQHQDAAAADSAIMAGGLDGWVAQALRILALPQTLAPSVKKIIMSESGGNPHAINNWDANARRGTPSQGLMQTIPSTFRHYVAPDLAGRPITDPVANITAGIRYMIENYGVDTVAAGGRSNRLGGYVGY